MALLCSLSAEKQEAKYVFCRCRRKAVQGFKGEIILSQPHVGYSVYNAPH